MSPADFITKWRNSSLKERSAAQEHFIDLCRLLGEPTPAEADPDGRALVQFNMIPLRYRHIRDGCKWE